MRYLMGIDNGGTFSKAAIFDENGKQIAAASVSAKVISPAPGFSERDMDMLWEGNVEAIRQVLQKSGISAGEIAGVAVSGHGKGLYMIGKDNAPSCNGILSTDTRARGYVEKWNANGTKERVFSKTFQEILASQPVSLLAWFKDNAPDVLKNTAYIFSVKDYIRFKLTGEANAEYTDFSGANLVNLNTHAYDTELLEYFGLADIYNKLPPLKHSADICGHITREAAKVTGLLQGTPVAAGMFDVDACGIAAGLSDEEQMCMIAGTWSINEYIRKGPLTNKMASLNSIYCIPGYYLVEESSPTSAGNMEWFMKRLMSYEREEAKREGKSIYEIANRMVNEIKPQESQPIFLPYLNGSGEDAAAKGTFAGLASYHDKRHMLRAVYEGIVFSHYMHVEKLLQNREKPKTIRLAGGAAKSDIWVQMFADVFQIPMDVIEEKELGAQGAAMAAGIATGIYDNYRSAIKQTVHISKTVYPRKEYKMVYEKRYKTYRTVADGLHSVWKCFDD